MQEKEVMPMKICQRTQGRLIALLCILLVVACTSVIFLPHSHEISFDSPAHSHGLLHSECAICVVLDISRFMLLGLVLTAIIHVLAALGICIHHPYQYIPAGREATPVGLKVKISD